MRLICGESIREGYGLDVFIVGESFRCDTNHFDVLTVVRNCFGDYQVRAGIVRVCGEDADVANLIDSNIFAGRPVIFFKSAGIIVFTVEVLSYNKYISI